MNINMNKERILQVENISKIYGVGGYKTEAIKDISFDVLEGEFLGIMGASGSGKTTLLNCIATMTQPSLGRVLLKNEDISSFGNRQLSAYRGKEIGYLFQEFELLDNLTGKENIMLPLLLRNKTPNAVGSELASLAERLDIVNVLEKFPSEMSGGQKQRVATARALIADPSIVLADEPTGALDSKNARVVMDKLALINAEQKKTIVMVTHNAHAAQYCSRILFIQDGLLFHELRKNIAGETDEQFYERIVSVMAQLGGGSANVL